MLLIPGSLNKLQILFDGCSNDKASDENWFSLD